MGRSKDAFEQFPHEAQEDILYSLEKAQWGGKALSAKPLQGFRGAGVLEIVENYDGDAYRAIYTVKFKEAVCVLHVFQKKSKRGIRTPRREMRVVEANLRGLIEYIKNRKGAK
ncbi:MAG: type II toxin-antitoxin system RelE/ParE family toxin [Nitrospinae bacterium]|nr:type II toxin-antitoxin system RelE/ParE family toxin [Nitrospinota bacterium]